MVCHWPLAATEPSCSVPRTPRRSIRSLGASGSRVLFTRAADLVRQLLEARDTRELTRLQQRLLRVDVLIVDELGFVPFDRTGGELLFNLLTDRYERRATVVTSNLAFAEWVTVFAGDEKLTTALLDRLAHHATVLTTKGKSHRMASSSSARWLIRRTHSSDSVTAWRNPRARSIAVSPAVTALVMVKRGAKPDIATVRRGRRDAGGRQRARRAR